MCSSLAVGRHRGASDEIMSNGIGVVADSTPKLRYVCVCFLPIHSGHQVRWTYQPGSHRRKVTQDF